MKPFRIEITFRAYVPGSEDHREDITYVTEMSLRAVRDSELSFPDIARTLTRKFWDSVVLMGLLEDE